MPILGIIASSALKSSESFDSIETQVLSSTQATITFNSIPQTYKHLQLRFIAQTNRATYNTDSFLIDQINGVVVSDKFGGKLLGANDTSSGSYSSSNYYTNSGIICAQISSSVATNVFGVGVVDILDYTNTNKFKTFMCFGGSDTNGTAGGYRPSTGLYSGTYPSTAAISSFRCTMYDGTLFNPYTHVALYGVKG
jgi:hypothetical protein